jgi:hypothetical protein
MGRLLRSQTYDKVRFICSNMIDDLARLIPLLAASLLIFSILFSPLLRQSLSHRYLVFLGGISFSMYLLHAILMRTILAWVIYGLFRQPWQEETVEGNETEHQSHLVTFILSILRDIGIALWMGLLLYVSAVWRNWVDFYSISLSKWLEEVMAGKKIWLFSK